MIKVLFVCQGNICRSPLAEGIFDELVKEQGLSKRLACDSAGISGEHAGQQPDSRSIQVAKEYGIKLNHESRPVNLHDFEYFDYIIPMDIMNQTDLIRLRNQSVSPRCQIIMMRKFDPAGESIEVVDPYEYDYEAFVEVYNILYRSIIYFIEYLKDEYSL